MVNLSIYLFQHLQTDQLDTRLKAVRLAGELFALPGSAISEVFLPIFLEFLKRLTDRVVGVRMSVLEHVKTCLLSNPLRPEAPQIICKLISLSFSFSRRIPYPSLLCLLPLFLIFKFFP